MKIDVTGIDVVKLVKKAYELSREQGLGTLHFNETPLTDDQAKSMIRPDGSVHLDYVSGRACKFDVHSKDGKFYIVSPWYDHTDEQLVQLLAHVGIAYEPGQDEHSPHCNCDSCRIKHAC